MGTNYYVRLDVEVCEACNRPLDDSDEELHIGKSSAGWCFGLHVIPELGLNTWLDWETYLKDKLIFNEYQDQLTLAALKGVVTQREGAKNWNAHPAFYDNWEQFHKENHSIIGPKHLVRSQIDGSHCVGHGPGTWDYIAGEFS